MLRFTPEARQWVDESPWPAHATRTDLPGGGIEVRLDVAGEVEMRPWVMRWGPNVEVLEPESLRRHIAESHAAAAALYASGPAKQGKT